MIRFYVQKGDESMVRPLIWFLRRGRESKANKREDLGADKKRDKSAHKERKAALGRV